MASFEPRFIVPALLGASLAPNHVQCTNDFLLGVVASKLLSEPVIGKAFYLYR